MFRWGYAIREILTHHSGEANLQEIYRTLEDSFPLEGGDRHVTVYGDRPAYQHVVRSVVSNLVQAGDLARVSRGRYALTERGRKRWEAERED